MRRTVIGFIYDIDSICYPEIEEFEDKRNKSNRDVVH